MAQLDALVERYFAQQHQSQLIRPVAFATDDLSGFPRLDLADFHQFGQVFAGQVGQQGEPF
jgi:hypothetical protein